MGEVKDPLAMRALAHPIRLALLEALATEGTLTATRASDLLGESPANCAFHLRTLARYGFVEEAGRGPGRLRRWRRTNYQIDLPSPAPNTASAAAADAFGEVWLDRYLARARQNLSRQSSWPPQWQQALGKLHFTLMVTPDEARQIKDDLVEVLQRHRDRLGEPGHRPPGTSPVEFLVLGYPQPPAPDDEDGDE